MARRWTGPRSPRTSRARREASFEHAVIGEAWRRHLAEKNAADPEAEDGRNSYVTDLEAEAYISNPPKAQPTPEALALAEKLIDANYEKSLGTCPHCGADYYDEGEMRWHADFECVGAEERFRG